MNILITGGRGFIGSELAKKLSTVHNVIIIDKSKDTSLDIPSVRYVCADLKNFNKIKPYFKNIDIVFHMAADISIEESINNCRDTTTNNFISTLNVLDLCKTFKIKKCIFSSTAAVYKDKLLKSKCFEADDTQILNPYAGSKLACEALCKMYSNTFGIQTIILRYFNVFGHNTRSKKYQSVLTAFLSKKLENKPLCIYGDGKQTRDFIHVSDVATANICAMNTDKKFYGEIFNVGTGTQTSIIKLAKTLSKNILFEPNRNGEIKFSCANIQKIKKNFNWTPKLKIIDWVKSVFNN